MQQLVDSRNKASFRTSTVPVNDRLTWDSFFDFIKSFVNEDTIVLTDTGLSLFPSAEIPIDRKGGYLAQTAWLSIGYTCGATLGVALANEGIRPIVFVGDGGFQMGPQAFSTLVRECRDRKTAGPVIFVMDNGLYGIEQFLIDEQILPAGQRFYRDNVAPSSFDILTQWDYVKLAEAFHGRGFAVSTIRELDLCLSELSNLSCPAIVAIKLDPHDLPRSIQEVVSTPRTTVALVGGSSGPSDNRQFAFDAFN
jgi:indolepyruvate decarboxylase